MEIVTPDVQSARSNHGRVSAAALLLGGIGPPMLFTVPAPILAAISEHYATTHGEVVAQLIMTLPAIGIVIGAPFWGRWVDRLGAKTALISAMCAFGAMGLVPLGIENPWILLATRLLSGLCAAGGAVATTALITSLYGEARRARLIAFMGATGAAAGITCLLVSGMVADQWGWRTPFALYAAGFAIAAAIYLTVPNAASRVGERHANTSAILKAHGPLYGAVVLIFAISFLASSQSSFLLAQRAIVSPIVQSLVIGAGAVANIVGGLSFPLLVRVVGRAKVLAILLLSLGCGALIMGASPYVATAVTACGLMGIGCGLATPYFINTIIDRAGVQAGPAVGLCYSAIFIGEFVCPLLMLPFRVWAGLGTGFVVIGSLTALGGCACLSRRGCHLIPKGYL